MTIQLHTNISLKFDNSNRPYGLSKIFRINYCGSGTSFFVYQTIRLSVNLDKTKFATGAIGVFFMIKGWYTKTISFFVSLLLAFVYITFKGSWLRIWLKIIVPILTLFNSVIHF